MCIKRKVILTNISLIEKGKNGHSPFPSSSFDTSEVRLFFGKYNYSFIHHILVAVLKRLSPTSGPGDGNSVCRITILEDIGFRKGSISTISGVVAGGDKLEGYNL